MVASRYECEEDKAEETKEQIGGRNGKNNFKVPPWGKDAEPEEGRWELESANEEPEPDGPRWPLNGVDATITSEVIEDGGSFVKRRRVWLQFIRRNPPRKIGIS
ncbi:unnamed protein product [Ilex paraguariensis]|uniref:Uncharacterized protein n=1 Tax=Ilex paraguariensis TaxID=185542 RepID=A0ABC8RQ97_9AQUA